MARGGKLCRYSVLSGMRATLSEVGRSLREGPVRRRISCTSLAYCPHLLSDTMGFSCGARCLSVSLHFSISVYLPVRPARQARREPGGREPGGPPGGAAGHRAVPAEAPPPPAPALGRRVLPAPRRAQRPPHRYAGALRSCFVLNGPAPRAAAAYGVRRGSRRGRMGTATGNAARVSLGCSAERLDSAALPSLTYQNTRPSARTSPPLPAPRERPVATAPGEAKGWLPLPWTRGISIPREQGVSERNPMAWGRCACFVELAPSTHPCAKTQCTKRLHSAREPAPCTLGEGLILGTASTHTYFSCK